MEILETIKQLDTKQKITGVITVFLLIFLVYLAYNTFAGNGSSAPPPAPKKTIVRNQPAASESIEIAHNDAADPDGPSIQMHQPPQQPLETQSANIDLEDDEQLIKQDAEQPSPEQLAFLQQTRQMQQDYLQLVNEFQLAQLQQKLEDAKAQIADARLKSIVSTAKQQQLEDELQQKGQSISGPSVGSSAGNDVAATGMQVVYVGQRRGQWSAMLSEGSSYFEVHVGTRLGNGWQVARIDSNGVILQRDDEKRLLPMPRTLG